MSRCTAALKCDNCTNWGAGLKLYLVFLTVCAWSGKRLYKIAPPDFAKLLPVHIRKMGLKGKFQFIQPCPMLLQVITFYHTGVLLASTLEAI